MSICDAHYYKNRIQNASPNAFFDLLRGAVSLSYNLKKTCMYMYGLHIGHVYIYIYIGMCVLTKEFAHAAGISCDEYSVNLHDSRKPRRRNSYVWVPAISDVT